MKNKGKLSAILRITAAVLIIVAAFMTLITYHCGIMSSRHTLYEAEEGDILLRLLVIHAETSDIIPDGERREYSIGLPL